MNIVRQWDCPFSFSFSKKEKEGERKRRGWNKMRHIVLHQICISKSEVIINNQVYTCPLYMVEDAISLSLAFWPRSNIGTDKSAGQSGATLRHSTRVIYLTQTHQKQPNLITYCLFRFPLFQRRERERTVKKNIRLRFSQDFLINIYWKIWKILWRMLEFLLHQNSVLHNKTQLRCLDNSASLF